MRSEHRSMSARVVCVLLIATAAKPANAGQIVTKTDVALAGVGLGALGAGIGIGIYYAVRHNRSLSGCTSSGPNGLQLMNKGDQQTYLLVGDIAEVKPGERIRVSGKKKKGTGVPPQFLVEKLAKDYGACSAAP